MSIETANDLALREEAVTRVLNDRQTIEEVASAMSISVKTLQDWVAWEAQTLQQHLDSARQALNGPAQNANTEDGGERPWFSEQTAKRQTDDSNDAHNPKVVETGESVRDAISRAVNSPDSALLLTNETQLEDTLRSARQTAQVCGVILVLGPKDNNETIDVEPEAPSADSEAEMPQSPFDTREEDGCVALYIEDEPTEPEDYQVPSSRRRPFPQPRPKSLNGSDGGKDETPGASRPEDPTQLEFYRSGSSSDVVDQQCRQSGEYQLQPTEEDEENEALKDRVYRFNFVEDGQDAELPGVNYDENLVLKFRCENCDRKLKAKGETIGKKVRCKGCMKRIRAPKDADDPRVYFSSTDAERGSETGGSSTL